MGEELTRKIPAPCADDRCCLLIASNDYETYQSGQMKSVRGGSWLVRSKAWLDRTSRLFYESDSFANPLTRI